MINKQDLQDFGLKNIEEYYDLIIDMAECGNLAGVDFHLDLMSKAQKDDLACYVQDLAFDYTEEIYLVFKKALDIE